MADSEVYAFYCLNLIRHTPGAFSKEYFATPSLKRRQHNSWFNERKSDEYFLLFFGQDVG